MVRFGAHPETAARARLLSCSVDRRPKATNIRSRGRTISTHRSVEEPALSAIGGQNLFFFFFLSPGSKRVHARCQRLCASRAEQILRATRSTRRTPGGSVGGMTRRLMLRPNSTLVRTEHVPGLAVCRGSSAPRVSALQIAAARNMWPSTTSPRRSVITGDWKRESEVDHRCHSTSGTISDRLALVCRNYPATETSAAPRSGCESDPSHNVDQGIGPALGSANRGGSAWEETCGRALYWAEYRGRRVCQAAREAAGAEYVDVAKRKGGGEGAMLGFLSGEEVGICLRAALSQGRGSDHRQSQHLLYLAPARLAPVSTRPAGCWHNNCS